MQRLSPTFTTRSFQVMVAPAMRRVLPLLRPAPVLVLAAWLVRQGALDAHSPESAERGVARAAADSGLEVDGASVHFVEDPPCACARGAAGAWQRSRAVLRARRRGEPFDVYLARTRRSPEGALLDVIDVLPLTRTSAVDEEHLVTAARHAAWVIGGSERVYHVELADLTGEPMPPGQAWSRRELAQRYLTNLQHTGQGSGIGRRSFKLDPPAERVALSLDAGGLSIDADGRKIRVPYSPGERIAGERFVREVDRTLARPGNLVTWAVDRARDLSWFGDERMQLTKAIAYKALDVLERALGTVRPPATEEDASVSDLGTVAGVAPAGEAPGWPPPPIPAPSAPPLRGEGEWLSLEGDPYVQRLPGRAPPLVSTYVRGDGKRQDSFVYVVAWDPRQVALHVVAGTEEPQTATGETGSGQVPRDPEVLTRLVAGFNGAFQSTHGDFGIMAEGELLVPPMAYGATVGSTVNGDTVFGTWPGDLDAPPPELVELRQNLTPLVENGELNPYRRSFWGGVPETWEDDTRTVRSGLCRTRDGFVLYFYATKIDHLHLGGTMLAARCDYGIHLDMNQGHTGLELYRIFPKGSLPRLAGNMDGQWQAQGDVDGIEGLSFRGRRLVRNLQLMHFPRYVRRSARDFFYLTLRPLLPGEPIVLGPREPGEGDWTTEGLPQHGFPHALATTSVRPDASRPETKVRVLALDPEQLRVSPPGADAALVVAMTPTGDPRAPGLFLGNRRATLGMAGHEGSTALARGSLAPGGNVSAAIGIDPHGKVLYAEVVTGADPLRDGALLGSLLDHARCTARLFLEARLPLAIGGTVDLSGHPADLLGRAAGNPAAIVRLARDPSPRARRIFEETVPPGPEIWGPIQKQKRLPREAPVRSSTPSE